MSLDTQYSTIRKALEAEKAMREKVFASDKPKRDRKVKEMDECLAALESLHMHALSPRLPEEPDDTPYGAIREIVENIPAHDPAYCDSHWVVCEWLENVTGKPVAEAEVDGW